MTHTAHTAGSGTASAPAPDPPAAPVRSPRSASGPGHRTVPPGGDAVLASDAEREHVTDRLRAAAAEGRLTLAEADERQATAYAARTRDELVPLVSDLPRPAGRRRPQRGPLTPRARRILAVHGGVTAAVFLLMLLAWLIGPAPFVPVGPLLLMLLVLFVHSRRAEREPGPDATLPDELR
ncbi:DUF1707 domain-containing protein [Pseudonocardia sp. NPDC049635]|uniref:DUF1707 SHOCT-like domain-containing protein n=1 Tax=Pseudonocardia sp. NPDC049635 TaxID=3155506 RepID=UPI00340C3FC5